MSTKNNSNFDPIGLSSFFGGQSVDTKLGTQAQCYDEEHTDFRSVPSNFSALPGPRRVSGSVVTGLINAGDRINSGDLYWVDSAGSIYLETTAEVWSLIHTLGENGGAGLTYRSDLDNIYITGQSKLARIFHVSSTNSFDANFFTVGISQADTCYKTGGTNTYTLKTYVNEFGLDERQFTTDIEPLRKIGVKVVTPGTGDWTLWLHDDGNNLLGTVTISNADLIAGVVNYFVFSSPVTLQRGDNGAGSAQTYHYHITSTVADGTIQTTTANSMADCDMELWADALITTRNALHPTTNFLDMTLIGNGRYVASYEPLQDKPTTADFNRHRLTFPPGFEVCGFAQRNLMVIIGCEKRSTSGEFQEGALFYWDGISDTYNDWWPVPEGSPESLFSQENTAHFIANGALYEIQSTDQPVKIRTLRNTNGVYSGVNNTTHAYPNMMTVHKGILHFGYPSNTTNQSLKFGVYSMGTISREYPISFGYGYTPSPGHKYYDGSHALEMGLVRSYGDKLYMSWHDAQSTPAYGMDVVDNLSSPASTFSMQPLIFDDARPYAYKNAGYIIATFDPWPAGATLTVKYKFDDDAAFTYDTQTPAVGDQYLVVPIDRRFLVATFGLDGTISGSTSPNISSFFMWVDPLAEERPIGG